MSEARLRGRLTPKTATSTQSYQGHSVRLEFARTAVTAGLAGDPYRASLTATTDEKGEYSFVVDAAVREDATARLDVRSPLGTRLASASLRELLDHDRIRPIAVDPETPFTIHPHPDPLKGRRQPLSVYVLDREGRKVANRQVVIVAADSGSPGQRRVVFTGRTDDKGYASGPYPRGQFADALAQVAGIHTPLRLEEDGSFPLRVVFALTLPAGETGHGAPAGASPPRAPDEEQLLNSPESFSADLGAGCIDFTVPNRTLEELPFYKIVRTTDPEIKGTHLDAPVVLPPDFSTWIKRLAFGQDALDSKLRVKRPETPLELSPLDAAPSASQPRTLASSPADADRERATAASAAFVSAARGIPPLAAIETYGVRTAAQWRAAIDPPSIDAALAQALPEVSAETLRSVLVDPDEFTPISLMTAERLSAHQGVKDLLRVYRHQAPGRAPLTEENFVDWDDTPTFYQATSIAHGHLLQYRQVWKADGYSLGDLVHSIPLAPCQKKQIVTVDWDRREDATRTEDLTEREVLFANLVRDRDVKEMMDTALSEDIKGGSTAKTYGGGGGLGFAIGPLVIGAAGGGGGADSEAWQNSSRELSTQTMHELADRINQSAAAVRSQRATVVQTLSQGERTRVETEVIANHNHCHALTMQYFEVLRHFQVVEELVEVRECLFVPFLMSTFHDTKALRWREALSRNLLKRPLQPGFDAIERIQLNYAGVDFPLGSFAEEPLQALDGELTVRITVARPRDPKKDEADYFETVWPFWSRLIGGNPADVFERYLQNQQFKDRIFREQLAPQIAERFIASLRVVLIDEDGGEVEANLDPTLASKYREGGVHTVTLADSGNTPPIARKSIVALEIRTDYDLPEHSQVIIESAAFLYETAHLRHDLYRHDRVLDDLLRDDPVYVSTASLTREEERNPRAEDLDLRRQLIAHLNANLEYYHKVIWWKLDKERRFILLDGFIAPHSGGRSVASVVENDLIGIVGNSLVFPVVAGFQLDPRYRAVREAADPEKPIPTLLDLYAPLFPDPPRVLSVPTKGVFGEAVLGACNSCEKIDESRFWRWSESPCPDDPPRIAEVSAASRAGETPNLTATDFPAALVNFQAIPEAPDPGGLRAALGLLGRPDLFRDITGLTQNQKNALGALQASLATAQAFGQEAVQLAQAKAAQRTIDQTLKSAEQAKKDGRLTDEEAREITKGALKALIGQQGTNGGSVIDSPKVQEAIGAAASAKKGSVTITDSSAGQQQTVEVSQEGGPGAEGSVTPPVVEFDDTVSDFINLPATIDSLVGGNWVNGHRTRRRAYLSALYMPGVSDLKDTATGEVVAKLHWLGVGEHAGLIRTDPTDADLFQALAEMHICYPANPSNTSELAASDSPYPVALLIHGNHQAWIPNYSTVRDIVPPRSLPAKKKDGTAITVPVVTADSATPSQVLNHTGYEELQRELARDGIVSVSVNTNFANSLNSMIRMRSDTALRCLDLLRSRVEGDSASRYFGRLDFNNVAVMGHSRGGDAAVDCFRLNQIRGSDPVDPRPTYGIRAICSLAPTDYSGEATGTGRVTLTSADETSLFVLYGSQDCDVFTGDPFKHYDRAGCPKSLVFVTGASHNGFNSQWALPDPRQLPGLPAAKILDRPTHVNLANEYIAGFFRWKLKNNPTAAPLFNGSRANTAGPGGSAVTVKIQWEFGDRVTVVDDFETDGSLNNRSSGRDLQNGVMAPLGDSSSLDARSRNPHQTKAARFALTTGNTFRLREQLSFLDFFQDYDVLAFRMMRSYVNIASDTKIREQPFPSVRITLRASGAEDTVANVYAFNPLGPTFPDHQTVRLPNSGDRNVTKLVLETFSVPISAFAKLLRGPIDPNAVPEIVFDFDPATAMTVSIDSVCLVKR